MNSNPIKTEGSFRVKGIFNRKNTADKPLVSVVTVVFNGAKTLEQTMQSVIDQTYDNIEYIIVDGGSTDGTIEIIKKYEKYLAYWTIGLVRGIYDQMNEGIDLATGDIIYFLNSDDMFYSNNVLEIIVKEFKKDERVGIVYGLTERFSDSLGIRYIDGGESNYLKSWKWLPTSHQSMLFRKKLFDILGKYNTKFKIFADLEFFVRFIKRRDEHGYKDIFINNIVSKVNLYGRSSQNLLHTLAEREQIGDLYFEKSFYRKFYFRLQWIKYFIMNFVIKIGIMKYYRKVKYGLFKRCHG